MSKIPMRARGSSLRKGGHKTLHLDELPIPKRSVRNSYGISEVDCTAKAFMKWSKERPGSAVILTDTGKEIVTLPLEGQVYKQIKNIFVMLRAQYGVLQMRHVS